MSRKTRPLVVVASAVMLALAGTALAADIVPTVITIPGMDCGGCAKKVAAKLVAVQGVAKAEPDMETKTIKVTLKADAVLSPKALWEAVEKAKQQPMKLEGPSGTFTSKPKQESRDSRATQATCVVPGRPSCTRPHRPAKEG
ncbi:MAG: heavy-metal-associated domain-containing protein [Gemmataceae bacterium]|jgi:Cu+-exporting ATPase|nr:heavy-metal-associated domain-containing protein [Gemmataceae bacterium]